MMMMIIVITIKTTSIYLSHIYMSNARNDIIGMLNSTKGWSSPDIERERMVRRSDKRNEYDKQWGADRRMMLD